MLHPSLPHCPSQSSFADMLLSFLISLHLRLVAKMVSLPLRNAFFAPGTRTFCKGPDGCKAPHSPMEIQDAIHSSPSTPGPAHHPSCHFLRSLDAHQRSFLLVLKCHPASSAVRVLELLAAPNHSSPTPETGNTLPQQADRLHVRS